ncbi:hypothetical protein QH494_23675 [Sphingomonas sp. AR_OL41]|uniref:hypothetical protein n=1 Tax=Sphingomonas sp. AR_OL41 TaxID=3042729 RepID=UPI0024802292|nr:hypothetical protein [Sphingomonas sp. AR_OL41]MDH7975195.1 hypothetical protein [Sphingomonas sp. AR_OL41]
MTIYAVGLGTDKTMQHFVAAAGATAPVELIDMNVMFDHPWRFALGADGPEALCPGAFGRLDPEASYYIRPVDLSPVLMAPWSSRWRAMLAGLSAFLESAPGRIANRPGGHTHNGSKPLHEYWLSQQGFDVPPAIASSARDALAAFAAEHDGAICKSLCGVRGTARLVQPADFADFDPRQGPVHLQRRIVGDDVRVHLIGTVAHGERIVSQGIDYRDRAVESDHMPIDVPPALVARMAESAAVMGMAFTGWDFKIDRDGRWWCLEVNPMPGYDGYDRRSDGAITRTLVRWLRDG